MSKKKLICLMGCMLAISHVALGAEWSVVPSIRLQSSYDDNIYLTTGSHKSIWGVSVSPLLRLGKRTQNSEIFLTGRATFNHYSQKQAVNPDAQIITLASHYDTQLNVWRLDGYYKRDTTSTTIAVEPDTTSVTGSGSSIVNVNLVPVEVRQNDLSLHPSWTRKLAPKTSLSLGYGFNDVFYDGSHTSLSDYQQHGIGAAISHKITQRDDLGVMANASLYRASSFNNEANNYGIQMTLDHDYTETLHGTLRVGGRYTSSTVANQKTDTAGLLLTAILNKQYSEVTSYRITLGRSVLPSGSGEVVETDLLAGQVSRDLSPRLNFALWGNVFKEKSINVNTSGVSRTYLDIEPSLRYQITRQWTVDGSYRYRWQKYRSASTSADGNAVFISLNYNWPRIAVSR